jgi:hypothetical protein
MKEAWAPNDERHRNIFIRWFPDYLDDLRGLLLDNHLRFFVIPRFLVVLRRWRSSNLGRWWRLEKGLSGLTDYRLGSIRGKRESFGIGGAACGRQHFVQYLRSEWVADFPTPGRLNPGATQRAKGILVVIPDESQILGELLRECTLAQRGICSAG